MIFCIGNGESRKDFDLDRLRPFGKIYGCNGLYRDFAPDLLLAMDYNICHEIYRSGYAFDHNVMLKTWEKNPASMYDKLFLPETVAKFIGQDIDDIHELTDEWAWKGEKKRFFVCWANNRDLMKKMRESRPEWNEDDMKLYLSEDQEGYLITWTKKKDKVVGLGKYKDEKTNAGILIAHMAAEKEKLIYLLGYDYYSKTETVNNIYKDTKGYVGKNAHAIKPDNWIMHTKRLLNHYDKDHKFVHVGEPIEELSDRDNWENISYEELDERISRNEI
tara:strand:+ start:5962 stop:6786 length:825 start_codon:yes stop_codon:yes gene_type:complete